MEPIAPLSAHDSEPEKPPLVNQNTIEEAEATTIESLSGLDNGQGSLASQPLLSRKKAAALIILLLLLVAQAINMSQEQFIGSQGWANVLTPDQVSGSTTQAMTKNQAGQNNATSSRKTAKTVVTPQAYTNQLVSKMSLDQKLGQMMMVQFVGATYSLPLATMVNQYHVGSVLLFYANGNIVDKSQLKTLTHDLQRSQPDLPVSIALDQEGGTVDRLQELDGPRPSEAAIGASHDPQQARAAGTQTSQDLSSYGITLNLAPVVDVDTAVYSELHQDQRTFGTTPDTVTRMAQAYLEGLQENHNVVGTLKHFPGLGNVTIDPHYGIPSVTSSKSELENIDWAPYRALIKQGQAHAIMVTHEIVPAIDPTLPASLSPKLIQGILRDEMGFQGVIMTDSLTMAGITAYYPPDQAAAIAIEAGSDMIMGASNPDDVATMIQGIKQAIASGAISQTRIDASVQRILLLKYQMGLLPIPTK
ncbi:hypothetical protein KDW_36020 [Dictyobacter vulcani]|uniref:beta-N-acetylhexosaminidase n=1 Tax=Dictyobacter vulcani TaxID=2607529 RepID=A0A5J4KSL7_9CHLR|nr:glycoside hydrolase family 3 protein [Dictyobacter vulcani]GER89440.1 hypothetical protein KDW_36020 [Dictyobacter vulcani]